MFPEPTGAQLEANMVGERHNHLHPSHHHSLHHNNNNNNNNQQQRSFAHHQNSRHQHHMFRQHWFSQSYLNDQIELDYQHYLGEKHLRTFRLVYLLSAILFIYKIILISIYPPVFSAPYYYSNSAAAEAATASASTLTSAEPTTTESDNFLYQQAALNVTTNDGSDPDFASHLRVLMSNGALKQAGLTTNAEDLAGVLSCYVAGLMAVGASLLLSYKLNTFLRAYYHTNLIVFLIVGLVGVSLPSAMLGGTKSFVVVSEIFLLIFPFALLLRINFARCVVGSWTVVIWFYVLHFLGEHTPTNYSSQYGKNGNGNYPATTPFETTPAAAAITPPQEKSTTPEEAIELITVGMYLVIGVLAFNYLARFMEKLERKDFYHEFHSVLEEIEGIPMTSQRDR